MKEETGLVPIEKINAAQIFRKGVGVDELIEYVKTRAYEVPQDVLTAKSRKAVASQAHQIARSKTLIERIGKSEVDELKKETKQIDSVRKNLKDSLDALKDEYRKPLTEWEAAEAAREASERLEIEIELAHEEAIKENETFDKLKELEQLKTAQARKEAEETAKREAERLEKERIEREKRIAEEAAYKAKVEAEAAAKRAQEESARRERDAQKKAAQAERDRIAAIERAKIEAEQAEARRIAAEKKAEQDRIEAAERAEREKQAAVKAAEEKAKAEAAAKESARLAQIAKEKAEADKRAKDAEHRKTINNEALACFEINGITNGKEIITLIAKGMIDHVTIQY